MQMTGNFMYMIRELGDSLNNYMYKYHFLEVTSASVELPDRIAFHKPHFMNKIVRPFQWQVKL